MLTEGTAACKGFNRGRLRETEPGLGLERWSYSSASDRSMAAASADNLEQL